MFIGIRLEADGSIYLAKDIYNNEMYNNINLAEPPYSFTKIEIEDKYSDCVGLDFNEDLSFSVDKYNARKQVDIRQNELFMLQNELTLLSHDIIQAQVGAVIDNIEERKARFKEVHNRIREIMGKEPRVYDI